LNIPSCIGEHCKQNSQKKETRKQAQRNGMATCDHNHQQSLLTQKYEQEQDKSVRRTLTCNAIILVIGILAYVLIAVLVFDWRPLHDDDHILQQRNGVNISFVAQPLSAVLKFRVSVSNIEQASFF